MGGGRRKKLGTKCRIVSRRLHLEFSYPTKARGLGDLGGFSTHICLIGQGVGNAKMGGRNRKAVSYTLWGCWSREWEVQADRVVILVSCARKQNVEMVWAKLLGV